MSSKLVTIGRRDALKRIATVGTGAAVAPHVVLAADPPAPPKRPLTDPDLVNPVIPWEKVLSAEELKTLAVLCDLIVPADEHSPSASKVGVPDFINEWVSAPYPTQQADQQTIRGGLAWLNTESHKRFGRAFADLAAAQHHQICDDICHVPKAKPQHKVGARFFDRLRSLTVGGFYTTPEGMKDVQYIGNVPSASFEGPPPEVLKHLKLL